MAKRRGGWASLCALGDTDISSTARLCFWYHVAQIRIFIKWLRCSVTARPMSS